LNIYFYYMPYCAERVTNFDEFILYNFIFSPLEDYDEHC